MKLAQDDVSRVIEMAWDVELHARLNQICILASTIWSHAFLQGF